MTTISDSFDRANGALGANYARGRGPTNGVSVASNAARVSNASADCSYIRTDELGDDQEAFVTITGGMGSGIGYAEVCARASGQDGTYQDYSVYTDGASGAGHTAISRILAGTGSELKPVATTFSLSDELGIRVTGANPVVISLLKNGVVVDSFSDSTGNRISSGGSIGIGGYAETDAARPVLDNLHGGDVAADGISGDLSASESGSDALEATGNIGNNGIRLTLRDTDTGALAANLTDVIVSIRSESDATSLLDSSTDETTDANGVLELASGSIGDVGDYIYVTVERSDNSIVATYRVQVIDLNA